MKFHFSEENNADWDSVEEPKVSGPMAMSPHLGQPEVKVTCVLRSGGPYKWEHVARLFRGVSEHLTILHQFICLTDLWREIPVCEFPVVPLLHDWPGWWSKMELFRPGLTGDILYLDLDTIIRGNLDDLACLGRVAMLEDFYRSCRFASGVMFLPEECRARVWDRWIIHPERSMKNLCGEGDQGFISRVLSRQASFIQRLLPGQVVSYKVHKNSPEFSTARVICFHGRPRPWEVGWLEQTSTPRHHDTTQ